MRNREQIESELKGARDTVSHANEQVAALTAELAAGVGEEQKRIRAVWADLRQDIGQAIQIACAPMRHSDENGELVIEFKSTTSGNIYEVRRRTDARYAADQAAAKKP